MKTIKMPILIMLISAMSMIDNTINCYLKRKDNWIPYPILKIHKNMLAKLVIK